MLVIIHSLDRHQVRSAIGCYSGDTLVFNVTLQVILSQLRPTTQRTAGAITVANNGTSSGTITWIPTPQNILLYL